MYGQEIEPGQDLSDQELSEEDNPFNLDAMPHERNAMLSQE
jgi:hypothetical protein